MGLIYDAEASACTFAQAAELREFCIALEPYVKRLHVIPLIFHDIGRHDFQYVCFAFVLGVITESGKQTQDICGENAVEQSYLF